MFLNEQLFSDQVSLHTQPALAALLARSMRMMAGWDADPIVLSPERRLDDPLWMQRAGLTGEVLVMPADRNSADLSQPLDNQEQAATAGRSWGRLELFEVLILLAAALFLVEAYLHTRGRIA